MDERHRAQQILESLARFGKSTYEKNPRCRIARPGKRLGLLEAGNVDAVRDDANMGPWKYWLTKLRAGSETAMRASSRDIMNDM